MVEIARTIATWGRPASEIYRSKVPSETKARADRVNELQFELDSKPRDPTPREAYAAIGNFVYQWRKEHPEYDVTYLEITRSSPQRLRMQFVVRDASLALSALAVIAKWAIAILIAAFVAVVVLPIIAPVLVATYQLITTGEMPDWIKPFFYLALGLFALWGFSKIWPTVRVALKKMGG